jgi:oxalate decarboxylase
MTDFTKEGIQTAPPHLEPSRRSFLGMTSAAFATAALATVSSGAQQTSDVQRAERDHSSSNPGPENAILQQENPNSNLPPPTDRGGGVGPIWYSFDLAYKRVEGGGWTRQVTDRELPTSRDIAGVNMRLVAGGIRELHWHTADEWAYVLYGHARVTVMQPDGNIFVGDVEEGDIWVFPAGHPHSIQGLGPDGCEFLLVFNQGHFSEDDTVLVSEWLARTPAEVLAKNMKLDEAEIEKLPKDQLYIFASDVPQSIEADKAAIGQGRLSQAQYTLKLKTMAPTKTTTGGEVRVVDSRNFPISQHLAAALVIVKPGGLREMHWHPQASEWQYYIAGKGRMTVFVPTASSRTVDFNANDVGYVPAQAGHYIENTGDTDLIFLETFASEQFSDVSLNNWLRLVPMELAMAHLNIDEDAIRKIPSEKSEVML